MRADMSRDGEDQVHRRDVAAGRQAPPRRLSRLEKALAAFTIALGLTITTIVFTLRFWPQPYFVVFKVTSTSGTAFISYSQGAGTRFTTVEAPWETSFYAGSGTRVSLSARLSARQSAVGCEIWVNGMRWKAQTAQGGQRSASCSGTLGQEEGQTAPGLQRIEPREHEPR